VDISFLFVAPAWRGRGLGAHLLDEFKRIGHSAYPVRKPPRRAGEVDCLKQSRRGTVRPRATYERGL
jgi:GNAT superfamily N-acetyltransferase